MGMSEFYGATNKQQSSDTLLRAIELGLDFFDTADIYGFGENEKLLGEVLKPYRNKIKIASKFGILRSKTDLDMRGFDASPKHLRFSIEQSLRNLQTDHIDLYYLHRMDPNTPIEETVGAMAELIKEGKIGHIGLSEASAEIIRRAHAIHPITAIQTEYSLLSRAPEHNGVLDTCKELGIGFVPYSPLSRGLLSSQQFNEFDKNDFRKNLPRFQQANQANNQKLIQQFSKLAKAKNCSTAQLCLAWVLAQGDHIVPIPGTRRIKYLEENIAATEIQLSKSELVQLNKISEEFHIAGARYPEEMMKNFQLGDEL
jgi:aryl-alcohol dehydrogenase-like predicted oxidoreductase